MSPLLLVSGATPGTLTIINGSGLIEPLQQNFPFFFSVNEATRGRLNVKIWLKTQERLNKRPHFHPRPAGGDTPDTVDISSEAFKGTNRRVSTSRGDLKRAYSDERLVGERGANAHFCVDKLSVIFSFIILDLAVPSWVLIASPCRLISCRRSKYQSCQQIIGGTYFPILWI